MAIFTFTSHIPRKCCRGLSLNDDPFWKAVVAKDAKEPFEMKGNASRSAGQLAGRQELCSLKHRLSHVKPRAFAVHVASCCLGWSWGSKAQRPHEPRPVGHPCYPMLGWNQKGPSGPGCLREPLWDTGNRGRTVIIKASAYLLWSGAVVHIITNYTSSGKDNLVSLCPQTVSGLSWQVHGLINSRIDWRRAPF